MHNGIKTFHTIDCLCHRLFLSYCLHSKSLKQPAVPALNVIVCVHHLAADALRHQGPGCIITSRYQTTDLSTCHAWPVVVESRVRLIRRSEIGKIGTHQKIKESDMCTVWFRFAYGCHAACQINWCIHNSTAYGEHLAATVTRARCRKQTGGEGVRGGSAVGQPTYAKLRFLSLVVWCVLPPRLHSHGLLYNDFHSLRHPLTSSPVYLCMRRL